MENCSNYLCNYWSIVNTISALSVKELPEEELNEGEVKNEDEKYGMVQHLSFLSKTNIT